MKQHLRVVVEVAVLGMVAMLAPFLLGYASTVVFNFFGSWGLSLSFLDPFGMLVLYAFPFALAFLYGYKRKLQLHLAAVWIGWMIGWLAYGETMRIALLRHAAPPSHKPSTPSLTDWLLWAGLILLSPLLPALVTMWGQRRRMRATQPVSNTAD